MPESSAQSAAQAQAGMDSQGEPGLLPSLPTPVAGNKIYYFRDGKGSVLGISQRGQIVLMEMPAGQTVPKGVRTTLLSTVDHGNRNHEGSGNDE